MSAQPTPSEKDFVITEEEIRDLVPWLHRVLPGQPKEDETADLCQTFSRLLLHSERHFGTERGNRQTCICRG